MKTAMYSLLAPRFDGSKSREERLQDATDLALKRRYKETTYQDIIAKYGDENLDRAIRELVAKTNDIFQRMVRSETELQFDLAEAQAKIDAAEETVAAANRERDEARASLEQVTHKEREEKVNGLLEEFSPKKSRTLLAFLRLEGYSLGLTDDGKLAAVAEDGTKQPIGNIVNDDFYARNPDARPASETAVAAGAEGRKEEGNIGELIAKGQNKGTEGKEYRANTSRYDAMNS